jgi:hypothetical protein
MGEEITIVGAGPAGLTAAIILKREGYNPVVYEAEATYGGDPCWHPSVHGSPVNFDTLEEYTGIDFSPVFQKVDLKNDYHYYYNLNEIARPGFDPEKDYPLHNTERGPRETSLDGYLYRMALDADIPIHFNCKWGKEDFLNAKPKTIVATGLGQAAYEARGVKFTPFYGFWTSQSTDMDSVTGANYYGDFSNEYAYACSINGLWYCLLFAKGDISQEELDQFKRVLFEIDGKKVINWSRFTGASVRHPMLFDGNLIFAGTAAGLIEPSRGFGIISALLSGRIAAWAVYDKEKAQAEYDKFIEPIRKHVLLKFSEKDDYVVAAFMKPGDLWFDIPTIKSGVIDSEAK